MTDLHTAAATATLATAHATSALLEASAILLGAGLLFVLLFRKTFVTDTVAHRGIGSTGPAPDHVTAPMIPVDIGQ